MGVSPDGSLSIEMLPARHGDALLLSWGPPEQVHHLLVDGGPARAYPEVSARLGEVVGGGRLDLLVLTHIDADHIEGAILAANDAGLDLAIDEVWFNGPGQLGELGAVQGEIFAAVVAARAIAHNRAFGGHAVAVGEDGPLPRHEVHGLTLTVLAPDRATLHRLRDRWDTELENQGLAFDSVEDALAVLHRRRALVPEDAYLAAPDRIDPSDVGYLASQPFGPDDSVPNASSIVLLAEYGGASILLAGDATAPALTAGVRRLLVERNHADRLELSALKLPHHGSARNLTRELLSLITADHYLVSSNGSRFGHPDPSAVARVLTHGTPGAELVFNYRSPQTSVWDDPEVLGEATVRFLAAGSGSLTIAPVGVRGAAS